jgi:putative hemolysin
VDDKLLQIDVESIIATKAGKKAKKIPKFVVNYLKKILHQNDINRLLREQPQAKDLDFVDAAIEHIELSVRYEGLDNVPEIGRFVFVANHPLGGLESLAMMKVVAQKYTEIVFPVNDMILFLTPLSGLLIPINKIGAQTRQNAELLNNAYQSDKQILYFPAGLCSRKINGKIVDLQWQKSFIQKAKETQRDIIPIFIDGKNSNFFYNLANLRKKIGVKFNIEMLFLVNEFYKQRGQTLTLKIGKPIPYQTFDNTKRPIEWAAWVKDIVYSLNK